jgi:hypothetical protein
LKQLACLANRRLKAAPKALREALRGRVTKHHRFLLRLRPQQIDALDQALAKLNNEVEANLDPFRPLSPLLISILGISERAAHVISPRLARTWADVARAKEQQKNRL